MKLKILVFTLFVFLVSSHHVQSAEKSFIVGFKRHPGASEKALNPNFQILNRVYLQARFEHANNLINRTNRFCSHDVYAGKARNDKRGKKKKGYIKSR